MAETNSIDVGEPVRSGDTGARAATISMGSPAQVGAGFQPGPAPDTAMNEATTTALLKLGSNLLQPKIQQAKQEQFMEGVQQAAQGEALKDIVAERPWYTEALGPSAAVVGATAYKTATTVAEWGAGMEAKMPQLAKQGPEALQAEMSAMMKSVMTGVPAADAAITAQIVEQWAPLSKRHAKAHLEYNTDQFSREQVRNWDANAKGFNAVVGAFKSGDKTVTQADVDAYGDRLLGGLNPFANQSDESYEKNFTQFVQQAGTSGNFHLVKMLKDKGLYDKLPDDRRAALDQSLRASANAALVQVAPKYALEFNMIARDTAQNPAGIAARFKELNDRVARETGITEAQYVNGNQIESAVGSVLSAQAAGAHAQQTAVDKAAAREVELARTNSQLDMPGGVEPCIKTGNCKAADAEAMALKRWATLDVPGKAALLNNNPRADFGAIAPFLAIPLNNKEYTPGVGQVAALYRGLTPDAKAHFKEPERNFLDRFTQAVEGGEDPASAYLSSRVATEYKGSYLDPKESGEVKGAIRGWVEKKTESAWLGINQLSDSSTKTAEMIVARQVKNRVGSIEGGVATAMSEALRTRRLQIVGKHAIIGDSSNSDFFESLSKTGAAPMARDAAKEAFEATVEARIRAATGSSLGDYMMIRTPDQNGKVSVLVRNTDLKTGAITSFFVGTDDIQKHGTAERVAKEADTGRDADVAWLKQRQAELNPKR